MKTMVFSVICLSFLSITCGDNKEKTRDFIPGIYVNSFTDSVSGLVTTGYDTLDISKAAGNENYDIKRSIKYRQTMNGNPRPEQYKRENWKATYDAEKNVLLENSRSKVITLLPKKNALMVNTVEYKKLK